MDSFSDLSKGELYLTSLYYTVTTMTTVGYGDINGASSLERGVSICIMIIGVIAFSFATSSLTSLLSNYDQANANLQDKVQILNRIYKDYALPLELYERLRQAVKYDHNKDQNDVNAFVAELPHKLKLEVSLFIHEQTYKSIRTFRGRSSAFIAWICPLLKPQGYPGNNYIYVEGDDVSYVFFLTDGKAGFVLPKYQNTAYIDIEIGSHFGIIDIIGSVLSAKIEFDDWMMYKDKI